MTLLQKMIDFESLETCQKPLFLSFIFRKKLNRGKYKKEFLLYIDIDFEYLSINI